MFAYIYIAQNMDIIYPITYVPIFVKLAFYSRFTYKLYQI